MEYADAAKKVADRKYAYKKAKEAYKKATNSLMTAVTGVTSALSEVRALEERYSTLPLRQISPVIRQKECL